MPAPAAVTAATAPETRPCLLLTEVGSINPWAWAPASWGYRSKEPHAGGFRPQTCNPSRLWGGKSAVEVWAGVPPFEGSWGQSFPVFSWRRPQASLGLWLCPINLGAHHHVASFRLPDPPVLSPLRTAVIQVLHG